MACLQYHKKTLQCAMGKFYAKQKQLGAVKKSMAKQVESKVSLSASKSKGSAYG